MRLFVAVILPERLRREAALAIERLGKSGADVKWVEADNLHVTLKFLAEVAEPRVEGLRAALRGVRAAAFRLSVEGVGTFPPRGRPRVVWLGLSESAELRALQAGVEAALNPLGFPPENRPFSAHLTVGRVRSPHGVEGLATPLRDLRDKRFGDWAVDGFSLMESRLSNKGPTYLHVEDYRLAVP